MHYHLRKNLLEDLFEQLPVIHCEPAEVVSGIGRVIRVQRQTIHWSRHRGEVFCVKMGHEICHYLQVGDQLLLSIVKKPRVWHVQYVTAVLRDTWQPRL